MWKEQKKEHQLKKEKQMEREYIEKYKIKKPFWTLIIPYLVSLVFICYIWYLYFNWDKIDNYLFFWFMIFIPSLIIYISNDDWNKELNFRKIIKKDLKYEFEYQENYFYTDSLLNYIFYIISKYILILLHILPFLYLVLNFIFSSYEIIIITILLIILIMLFLIYKKNNNK